MAAAVGEIVSLERMRRELRIPAGIDDHDRLIEAQLRAAVSAAARITGLPLLDRDGVVYAKRMGEALPLCLPRIVGFRSVEKIRYWRPGDELGGDPEGSVGFGRVELRDRIGESVEPVIYSVEGAAWPEILFGSFVQVSIRKGLDFSTGDYEAISEAVVLLARDFYDARAMMPENSSVMALLRPWQRV